VAKYIKLPSDDVLDFLELRDIYLDSYDQAFEPVNREKIEEEYGYELKLYHDYEKKYNIIKGFEEVLNSNAFKPIETKK